MKKKFPKGGVAGGEEARGTRCDDPFNQPDKEVPFVCMIVDMEADMLEGAQL